MGGGGKPYHPFCFTNLQYATNNMKDNKKWEELKKVCKELANPVKERATLYWLLGELGISFKKTNCHKCLWDYYNIVREELGLVESAAELSDFNCEGEGEWVYTKRLPVGWNGHIICQSTPIEVIREFVKRNPSGYFVWKRKENE